MPGSESPLKVAKATKERVTAPIEHLLTGLHTGSRLPVIVIRSLHGRVEVIGQSAITGADALAAARVKWPELTFVRVLRPKDGTRIGEGDLIHAGETVVASDWEAPDA